MYRVSRILFLGAWGLTILSAAHAATLTETPKPINESALTKPIGPLHIDSALVPDGARFRLGEDLAPLVTLADDSILPRAANPKTQEKYNDGNVHLILGKDRCKSGVLIFGDTKCYATNRGGYDRPIKGKTVEGVDHFGRPCHYIPPKADGSQAWLHGSIGPRIVQVRNAQGKLENRNVGWELQRKDVAQSSIARKAPTNGREEAAFHYNADAVVWLKGTDGVWIHGRDRIGNSLKDLEQWDSWGCTLLGAKCSSELNAYLKNNPRAKYMIEELMGDVSYDSY